MPLRPGRVISRPKRPWTRVSKSKPRKSYVVGVPYPKISQFEMGTRTGNFDCEIFLVSKDNVQIRDNALEASRIVAQKFLEKKLGLANYFLKILIYPHNVIREHSIATGAGADRFSQGMRLAFGRPVGKSSIVRKGQRLVMLRMNKSNIEIAKAALVRAGKKIRARTRIEVKE